MIFYILFRLTTYAKIFQRILYRFHFFRCRMFPGMFQFFYCIRSVIHRQAQTSLYLCYISSMYLEAIFSFYISFIFLYVTRSFGLYASALFAILSSGTLPSPSPNSTFTLICPSGFLWESSTTVSSCIPN